MKLQLRKQRQHLQSPGGKKKLVLSIGRVVSIGKLTDNY